LANGGDPDCSSETDIDSWVARKKVLFRVLDYGGVPSPTNKHLIT